MALLLCPCTAWTDDLPSIPNCTLVSSSGTAQNWTWDCDGETITGNAMCSDATGTVGMRTETITRTTKHDASETVHCWCRINTNTATYWTYATSLPANTCNMGRTGCLGYCYAANGDAPWNSDDNYQKYISALFSAMPLETPCDSGIHEIRTSTGITVPLYTERYTTPSIVVKYNDKICYAKLVPGTAQNQIHINYDNQTYHTTD
ncbi:MAG: hypothetical protein NC311_02325 [Muribaculaceae bacterium]|nr:hypothetical protein [Muribaculaceae bacterium]